MLLPSNPEASLLVGHFIFYFVNFGRQKSSELTSELTLQTLGNFMLRSLQAPSNESWKWFMDDFTLKKLTRGGMPVNTEFILNSSII